MARRGGNHEERPKGGVHLHGHDAAADALRISAPEARPEILEAVALG
jgi:hypothetical protein